MLKDQIVGLVLATPASILLTIERFTNITDKTKINKHVHSLKYFWFISS